MSEAKQGNDMKRAIERVSGSDCRCVRESNNGDEGISTSVIRQDSIYTIFMWKGRS